MYAAIAASSRRRGGLPPEAEGYRSIRIKPVSLRSCGASGDTPAPKRLRPPGQGGLPPEAEGYRSIRITSVSLRSCGASGDTPAPKRLRPPGQGGLPPEAEGAGWRRGRDSNPRRAMNPQRFSRPPLSTTQPPLRERSIRAPLIPRRRWRANRLVRGGIGRTNPPPPWRGRSRRPAIAGRRGWGGYMEISPVMTLPKAPPP